MKAVTINNFLKNPSGPYSAYFARRDLIIKDLEDRYSKLDKSKFEVSIYKFKDDYRFKFKVPSEELKGKITYDVFITFTATGTSKLDYTLNNYLINVFSNSPNFVFTYAYVYNQDGIIVPFLKSKLDPKCLTEKPKVRNPLESYGFEKSVYFALLYLLEKKYINKNNINGNIEKFNIKKVLQDIKNSEEKLEEYNKELKKQREQAKQEKENKKKEEELNSKKEKSIKNKRNIVKHEPKNINQNINKKLNSTIDKKINKNINKRLNNRLNKNKFSIKKT